VRELNFKGEGWWVDVDGRVILRPEHKARLPCKLYLPKAQES
jgi:hypothetical protein